MGQPIQSNQPSIQLEGSKKNPLIPTWLLFVLAVVMSASIIGYALDQYFTPEPVACTEDAKVCPDGSTVGRIPPDCEFAPCSEITDPTADWRTYRNEEYGYEVRYPEDWVITTSVGSLAIGGEATPCSEEITIYREEAMDNPYNPFVFYELMVLGHENPDNLALEDWMRFQENVCFEKGLPCGLSVEETEEIKIDNLRGRKGSIFVIDDTQTVIFLEGKSVILELSYNNLEQSNPNPSNFNTINQIISTLKFID